MGVTRLWLAYDEEGWPYLYREDTDTSLPLSPDNDEEAINCAKELMARTKEEVKP